MKDWAIYNVKINPGEWPNGHFSNIKQLKRAYQKVVDMEPFLGDFMLMNSHELIRGNKSGLHTLIKSIDVKEFIDQNYHFDWLGSGIIYLFKKGEKIVTEHYPQKSFNFPPCYTLEGLYETLPDQEFMTKVNAIKDELMKHDFTIELGRFNQSFEKNKKLDLKLLESYYKKYISDQ